MDWGKGQVGWYSAPFVAGVIIYVTYLLTVPFPGNYAGLYLEMAQQVNLHGYRLPARIPHFTSDGLPFAYPPLGPYFVAVLHDATGISYLTIARYVPGLVTLLYLVPTFLVGRELTGSIRKASFATSVVALAPAIFSWHLSSGGVVRAPAFLFTAAGAYTGLKLFRAGDSEAAFPRYWWTIASAVLFGLTLLTHPVSTVFFVATYLTFYAYFDRTARGLLHGVAVAFGGFLLASPWFLQVVAVHGADVFFNAAGTRGGIFPGVLESGAVFLWDVRTQFVALWHALVVVGLIAQVARSRYALAAWFGVVFLLIPRPRFLLFVGAFVVAAFVFDEMVPIVADASLPVSVPRPLLSLALVGLLLSYGLVTGVLYTAGYPLLGPEDTGTTADVTPADLEAMEWVRSETDADTTFVVTGAPYEWFPFLTNRTLLVSPLGAEWLGNAEYRAHQNSYQELTECEHPECFSQRLAESGTQAEYVYVSRGDRDALRWELLESEFRDSASYRVAFANDEVLIVRRTDGRQIGSASQMQLAFSDTSSEKSFLGGVTRCFAPPAS